MPLTVYSQNCLSNDGLVDNEQFSKRIPFIFDFMNETDVDIYNLQEIPDESLKKVKQFFIDKKYVVTSVYYHEISKTHLISACRKDIYVGTFTLKTGKNNKACGLTVCYKGKLVKVVNVHLPLSIIERLETTKSVGKYFKSDEHVAIIGDFNCIQRVGGQQQLDILNELHYDNHKSIILSNDGYLCEYDSTFYGFKHEKKDFQQFNSCDHLDRLSTYGLKVLSFFCIHKEITKGNMMSDHGALIVSIELVKNPITF
jgi:hypothetical protein